jgi:hypothetical protein
MNAIIENRVDSETSDIFFNFGCVNYLASVGEREEQRLNCLYEDANHFLKIVDRDFTDEDLVNDFLNRL